MASSKEKSQLKRVRNAGGDYSSPEAKKPRRSNRVASQQHELKQSQLPSPVTHDTSDSKKEGTVTPPEGRPSQITHRTPVSSPTLNNGLSSPPSDTQPFSQFVQPPKTLSNDVEDEELEGVWGYLIPADDRFDDKLGHPLVLRKRTACPLPDSSELNPEGGKRGSKEYTRQERRFERTKVKGIAASGYLIGRHPECDLKLDIPTVSNRHCLIFNENKGGDTVAILEDLSGNGTFVNEVYVGRNKRRELEDRDEIAVLDKARFVFRYPKTRDSHGFRQQYAMQDQLGKGHFASVYLCIEKTSGVRYAVKKFEKRAGPGESSRMDGLQQEIAVLMGVSHPNVLCLKDTFVENDGVYLVLELAPEGELFNWIILKSKLSEPDARKLFIQLFQGIKYLHERNIVHRDIKPENILLVDKNLSVKLADFGLSKIIGEESFTTTLCGTPSYVAPEILENSNHRRYTKAVDIWSLGVVLYICLCGFPPFSDELYSKENPYTLSQQIKMGRFDYPSPYWDPVSDIALDLIDRMLEVDVEKRITVEDCLEHPWITQKNLSLKDSTEGLTGAMNELDFSKRKPQRERTLLSSVNDVKITRLIDTSDAPPVKVFDKNDSGRVAEKDAIEKGKKGKSPKQKHDAPDASRHPEEFMQLGGKGDQPLFGNDPNTRMV